jgi:hypothetical protein
MVINEDAHARVADAGGGAGGAVNVSMLRHAPDVGLSGVSRIPVRTKFMFWS